MKGLVFTLVQTAVLSLTFPVTNQLCD